jgi:cellulose synthase/poly-beta-1,6-N-acetylglucosamine synthase-like glycosyltransferase
VIALLDALLLVAAAVLAIPCLVFFFECLVALLPGAETPATLPAAARPRAVVMIPAHNEQAGVGATVTALRADLGPQCEDRVLVVADNCSDDTAAVARAAGAEVIERRDPERRGKGFAIVYALDHLAPAPPEIVIIVDADCRISAGGLAHLATLAAARQRPVQAEYLLAAPEKPTPKGVLSALAVLVRNRVRPLGLRRLGLPGHLTGSGMAFPWPILRAAPALGANLVEDLVMGLELALAGHPPLACPEVRVSSELPEGDRAAFGQRRRWEHGQLATLARYGPRLLAAGVGRGSADLLALGLDLVVPPLALLVMLVGAATAAAAGAVLLGASPVPLALLATSLGAVGVAVLGAWIKFGRATLPLRYVVVIPLYVLWKIPLYLAFFLRGKHKTWERTERKGEATDRR